MSCSKLAAILHTLSCQKDHAMEMELLLKERHPNVCYFYLEDSLSDPAECLDQQKWEVQASLLCKDLDLPPEDILRCLPQLLELRGKLDQLLDKYPTAAKFARLVLLDEPL